MLLQAKETEYGQMISAKELHQYMKAGRVFSSWIRSKIDKYQYEENFDYKEFWTHNETGEIMESDNNSDIMAMNGYGKDYFISYDMAKELCILENNNQSKRIRKYLKDCESNYLNFLKAKLYLLDEGKIDIEKLNQWQELLEFVVEFEPNLKTFIKQLITLIDQSSLLHHDVKGVVEGLDGINI